MVNQEEAAKAWSEYLIQLHQGNMIRVPNSITMTPIEIVNAINTAVAKGWTVKLDRGGKCPDVINGAIIDDGKPNGIQPTGYTIPLVLAKRIYATMQAEIEVDVLYEQSNPMTSADPENHDLPKSSN